MASKLTEYYCYDCEGTFKVKHELSNGYKIQHCVFCGADLQEDDPFASDEREDEDDDEY